MMCHFPTYLYPASRYVHFDTYQPLSALPPSPPVVAVPSLSLSFSLSSSLFLSHFSLFLSLHLSFSLLPRLCGRMGAGHLPPRLVRGGMRLLFMRPPLAGR